MEILQNTWIDLRDLKEQERNMFIEHWKNKENVYILCKNRNLEYRITNLEGNIINLEFTGKIIK